MKKRTRDRHVRSVFLQKILLVVFLMFLSSTYKCNFLGADNKQ